MAESQAAEAAQDTVTSSASQPVAVATPEPITNLQQFFEIKGPARNQPQPVRFEFDLDFYDTKWNAVIGRNNGLPYYFVTGATPLPIQVDQRYLLEGTLIPADAPSLAQLRWTQLPHPDIMPTHDLSGDMGNVAAYHRKRVRIVGYVEFQLNIDPDHHCFVIHAENTEFYCSTYGKKADAPILKDKLVSFEGILNVRKALGQQKPKLEIYGQCSPPLQVLGDIADHPDFKIERTPIDQITAIHGTQPVRVSGVVYEANRGEYYIIRDGTGLIKALTTQNRRFTPGEPIEAIGIPAAEGTDLTLRDAFVRIGTPQPQASEPNVLRLVDPILSLSAKEAAQGHPVQITGVVTWADIPGRCLYVQDLSAGIRVVISPDIKIRPFDLAQLRLLKIEGVTASGKFTPEIHATKITSIDWSKVPRFREVSYEQAMSGAVTGQWVGIKGFLRAAQLRNKETLLHVVTESGEFTAHIPYVADSLPDLVGATITLSGVCVPETSEGGESKGFSLLVPVDNYVMVSIAPNPQPFIAPERTLESLHKPNPSRSLIQRYRFTGQVVHHVPGRYLYVQEGNFGILALSRSTAPLKPGDRVELAGLTGREGYRPILRETLYRTVEGTTTLIPTILHPGQALNENLDGCLVQTTGQVLEASRREASAHFLIQTEHGPFEAILEKSSAPLPAAGAKVRLTGVYLPEYDEYRQARSFHLLLRSSADLEVLSAPSWWTTARALNVAGLLLACVLLVIGWVTILRRRVTRQTLLIREQLEKESLLEARHRDIIDNASDFIFTLDEQGHLTSFNPAGERMTGLHREQALGRAFNELLAPEAAPEAALLLTLRSETDAPITCQTRFKTLDGRIIWVEICARAHRQPGRPCGVLAVARDISDRKQIEEELRRARDAAEANTRAKSAFLANMSHEIRTPMNGVIGMSNLLLHDPKLTGEHRDFAETIRNSAESLLTVLNDILDFSKIEAGKLQIETIDFDLHDAVETTLELLAARAAGKNLEFASFFPAQLACAIRGDPGRLRQVLLNLLGNAIKFTDKGEVIVTVTCENESATDVRLHFEITDTGPGIDAETQTRLFQPFIQADGSTTRKHGGTGLGLAIAKQIIQLMQGEIGVRSTPGQGATFWFTVNLEKQPADKLQNKKLASPGALQGRHALIVDDNATNRKILQNYCADWGLRCETAATAADALTALRQAARTDPFQLVLTDYQMPEIDGLMLGREILKDEAIPPVHTLLLTSWDRRFNPEELSGNNIAHMLVKPLRQQDLLDALLGSIPAENHSPATAKNTPSGARSRALNDIAKPAPTASLSVLIAEDNIVNQRVAALQLQRLGHKVEIAANGLEVLKALESRRFDVILMDCQMPELDGYEATRRIRQNPAHANLSIIAMTANAMQGDRDRCLAAGMDDYVSKPTRPIDIQAALDRCKIARHA